MHEHLEIFALLAAKFPESKVKQVRGFDYVTARTVMNRLDDVLGPAGWWDSYELLNDGSILCRLTIRLPDGSTLTKCDVGGISKMKDESDSEKSGASDALKRAAVKFGVARYLYKDGIPGNVLAALRELREPRRSAPEPESIHAASPKSLEPPRTSRSAPRTGAELLGRLREFDRAKGTELLGRTRIWACASGFPESFEKWSEEQVERAVSEIMEMISVNSPC